MIGVLVREMEPGQVQKEEEEERKIMVEATP